MKMQFSGGPGRNKPPNWLFTILKAASLCLINIDAALSLYRHFSGH